MATFFDDEADRPEKPVAENIPADPQENIQPEKRKKVQFHLPDRKFWWALAGIALVVNISVTFSHTEGETFTATQSTLVTLSFLYLFVFAMFGLAGIIMKAPDPEDDSRTVGDKLRANRNARKAAARGNSSLTDEETRLLDQMEASMIDKKDQFDVIVLKDIWKFWEADGRAAR